jgi:hypothetical protein
MSRLADTMLAAALIGASASLYAQESPKPPTIIGCPSGFTPATVSINLDISTNLLGCPLLEDKELRKLIDKFGVGSVFAYPAIPFTCVSGTNLTGTIKIGNKDIAVDGFSESAQRLFPEAAALDPENPLFIIGVAGPSLQVPFASGAAMTVVSLTGESGSFSLDLVLADRFSINNSIFPAVDTEDFLVVGAKGDYAAVGRLTGFAQIDAQPGAPLENEPLTVSGTICLKPR